MLDHARVSAVSAFMGRVARYGFVGAAVSVLYSLAVIVLVDGMGLSSPTLASVVAFMAVMPISFVAQKRFTFRDAPWDTGQPLRFAVMATTSFVLATGGMFVITEVLHWSYLLGVLVAWVLIPAVNLLLNIVWVFPSALPGRPGPRSISREGPKAL